MRDVVRDAQAGADPAAERDAVGALLARLRQRGRRATPGRRLLLGVMFADRRHRSAEELAAEVQAQAPDVNISTIRRNLEELVQLGVVDRAYIGGGPAAYHLAPVAHGHLACEKCGSVTEVPDELFDGLASSARERYGFTVDPHHFAVAGRCAGCR